MIIGIAGKAQAGKDTACSIIKAIDVWRKASCGEINIVTSCKTLEEFCKEWIFDKEPDFSYLINCDWEKHSFAETLKGCAALILGCNSDDFESISFKNSRTELPLLNTEGNPMTNREFLQLFGTQVGRAIDKDLWVKALMNEYQFSRDTDGQYDVETKWIIPDVRFPNEEEAIHKQGGVVWKIIRDSAGAGNHESEKHIDELKVELEIDNNGTIDEFITSVIRAYKYTIQELHVDL